MTWIKKIFGKFNRLMAILKTGNFGTKPKRPKIQKIFLYEVTDDGEVIGYEKWIIVNSKGETLEAPIFDSKKDAMDWLDEHYPSRDYAPE